MNLVPYFLAVDICIICPEAAYIQHCFLHLLPPGRAEVLAEITGGENCIPSVGLLSRGASVKAYPLCFPLVPGKESGSPCGSVRPPGLPFTGLYIDPPPACLSALQRSPSIRDIYGLRRLHPARIPLVGITGLEGSLGRGDLYTVCLLYHIVPVRDKFPAQGRDRIGNPVRVVLHIAFQVNYFHRSLCSMKGNGSRDSQHYGDSRCHYKSIHFFCVYNVTVNCQSPAGISAFQTPSAVSSVLMSTDLRRLACTVSVAVVFEGTLTV